MGTWFEVVLAGDDPRHLEAVAAAALDEVDRLERRLSRFDPQSELSRINREAAARPVRVDLEMLDVLLACRAGWEATGRAFDVAAPASTPGTTLADLEIDADRRTVRFGRPGLALDLGGFAKGYALDRLRELVVSQGVDNARLHGGTSSVLALGPGPTPGDGGWTVAVRAPGRPPDEAGEAGRVLVRDEGFSCSATFGHNQGGSDLVDPARGRPLDEPAACVALAPSAAWAEVLSTALLVMGRDRARSFAATLAAGTARIAWLASDWEWFDLGP